MVNLRFILVAMAITLWFSTFGCAQNPSPPPTPSANESNGQTLAEESGQARPRVQQWWRDESIAAELELTDDQVRVINDLMTVSSGDANQQLQQERQVTLRYLRVLAQEPYDAALADRLSERLIEVLANEQRRRIQNVRALRDILTQEQWTTLWEVAPRVLQVGRFRALRGPKISVSGADISLAPTP